MPVNTDNTVTPGISHKDLMIPNCLLYLPLQQLLQSFSYLAAHGPLLILTDFCFDDKDFFGDCFNKDEVAAEFFFMCMLFKGGMAWC